METKLTLSGLNQKDVEIFDKELTFQAYSRLYTYRLRHKKFDGGWMEGVRREVFDTGPAVVVLPYDPAADSVVLIEQFRAPPLLTGRTPWLIECIAGRTEGSEPPAETARREALEEAGLTLKNLVEIGAMFMSPGVYAEYSTMYCAHIEGVSDQALHGLDDEHEDIRVLNVSFDAAMAALDQGLIASAPAQVCLNWLFRKRDALRRDWLKAG